MADAPDSRELKDAEARDLHQNGTPEEPESSSEITAEASPAIPAELPILPVRGVVVFPGTVMPLTIGREKSKLLIDSVLAGDKLLAIFAQRKDETEDPKIDDMYRVGTAAVVLKLLRMPDGNNSLLVHGLTRVGIEEMVATDPYWKARVHQQPDDNQSSLELEALTYTARRTAREVIELSQNIPEEAGIILENIEQPGALADYLAANLSLGLVQKQELLETFDVSDRLRKVNATLNNQLEILKLSEKIQTDVRSEIDRGQREYYLNEQLKAIKRELGTDEDEGRAGELEALRAKLRDAKMPEEALEEGMREINRLSRISSASPEHGLIRDYLDWLIEMPWYEQTKDQLDLKLAEHILNEDHFGLQRIKKRILEYLAVRRLKKDGRGPILCFVGPPGVGKTSLGQSIARALGRKFVRFALGGVRDEADIRGHRRTYIGSSPGRIVKELRKCGVRNPVMMLDELDKLGRDFRGDPASALLEVLDPAQNHSFTDHYLGVPFDLSKVLFIATANYLDPVDAPLLDRMEIIELGGYTISEKVQIAKRYLLPRQLEENGLAKAKIEVADELWRLIIDGYTREAGVRNLERKTAEICRAIASRVAKGEKAPTQVTPEQVREWLGPRYFERETALVEGVPGVVTGLAYTPVGGQIMFIEGTIMPGRGGFQLTGQIGDVMRESAQAAMSVVRANAARWNLDISNLGDVDIHIHVPAGAIPKDGPSAGVAMVACLVSLLADTPASVKVGMTGEITLRGLVLPIGGVKEKVLAAFNAGLTSVILPKRNEPDLEEVPTEVREKMTFVFVEHIDEALVTLFSDTAKKQKSSRTSTGKRKKTKKSKTTTSKKTSPSTVKEKRKKSSSSRTRSTETR
ncbi:MAG: endopeptidase La [Phycisphaerae bacterium]